MDLTHLGHACLLVETDRARVLLDPGTLSEGHTDLTDLDAVLITHKHFDHFDTAAVEALLKASPRATLVVEATTAADVPESLRERTQVVRPGDRFAIAGDEIDVVGGTHAQIHPDIDQIPNVGFYFTDIGLLHPGDEFTPPAVDVEVLALPVSGPWQGLRDTVDYLRSVRPTRAFPMHEAVLSRPSLYYTYLESLKPTETEFRVLEPGTAASL